MGFGIDSFATVASKTVESVKNDPSALLSPMALLSAAFKNAKAREEKALQEGRPSGALQQVLDQPAGSAEVTDGIKASMAQAVSPEAKR